MKRHLTNISLTLLLVSANYLLTAQDGLPSKPEDGKCYAKCLTQEEWKEETVKVLKKPAYKTLKVIPAEYKMVEEKIVIKPASKKFIYVPAKYKTAYDTITIEEGYNKLAIKPAKFGAELEQVEVKPTIGKWIMGERDPNCEGVNPDDCRIMHYRKYPAQIDYVPVEKLTTPEATDKTPIKAKFKVIKKEVMVEPAKTVEEIIPEETMVVKTQVLVKDETTVEEEVAAVYADVKKQILVKQGGLTVWKEVECDVEPMGEVLPVFYKVGSAELTGNSKEIIDEKLYKFLTDQPDVRVELSSHTDSRGSNANNKSLSQRRAESVVNYLISKGVNRNRMVAKGYGETKLVNKCADGVTCSEGDHALNRRTEFKIID